MKHQQKYYGKKVSHKIDYSRRMGVHMLIFEEIPCLVQKEGKLEATSIRRLRTRRWVSSSRRTVGPESSNYLGNTLKLQDGSNS